MQILFCETDMRLTEAIVAERQNSYKLWEKEMHKAEKNISIQVLLEKYLKVQLHVFVSQLCA